MQLKWWGHTLRKSFQNDWNSMDSITMWVSPSATRENEVIAQTTYCKRVLKHFGLEMAKYETISKFNNINNFGS